MLFYKTTDCRVFAEQNMRYVNMMYSGYGCDSYPAVHFTSEWWRTVSAQSRRVQTGPQLCTAASLQTGGWWWWWIRTRHQVTFFSPRRTWEHKTRCFRRSHPSPWQQTDIRGDGARSQTPRARCGRGCAECSEPQSRVEDCEAVGGCWDHLRGLKRRQDGFDLYVLVLYTVCGLNLWLYSDLNWWYISFFHTSVHRFLPNSAVASSLLYHYSISYKTDHLLEYLLLYFIGCNCCCQFLDRERSMR